MIRLKRGEGFTMSRVVILLLIVGGIFLFSPLVTVIIQFITGSSTTCTLSLIGGEGTAKCPIDDVVIYADKVEINDKKFMEKKSGTTDNMAKEALAKLLQKCLSRGGGYNSRAFSRDEFLTDNIVCLECFEVTIDESVPDIEGFTGYLSVNKPKGLNSDKTYLQALTKDESHLEAYLDYGFEEGLSPSQTFAFIPNEDYTIIFLGIKKGSAIDKVGRFWDLITFKPYKALFKNRDTYFAYITESNNLGKVCERKVN